MGEGRLSGDDTPNDRARLTVPEAARALGISPEAVRNRLSRGTLKSDKVEGTVYVLIDRDMARYTAETPTDRPGESSALISAKDETIAALREQLEQANERDRENRRIIAALTARIPAIEAPSETPQAPETASEGADKGETQGATEPRSGARAPWWRRVFGG